MKRTTLGRANKQRFYGFYEALFSKPYARCQTLSSGHKLKFKHKLFSLDSTPLDVSLRVFPGAECNRIKAAYKLHIALDHDGLILAFAAVTLGKVGDQSQAKLLNFHKGSLVVFDRGYNDFKWNNQLTDSRIVWAARIRGSAKYRVVKRYKANKAQGVTSGQFTECSSYRSMGNNLRPVRKTGYHDSGTGRRYVFITNHLDWSAKTVAEIYK